MAPPLYKLNSNIELVDLGLFFKSSKTLVISDIHLGYEEALNKKGVLIPRFQFEDTIKRLQPILEHTKPKRIIINGDLKHEFGFISDQEWREILKLIDLMYKYTKDIIIIKGNHDVKLAPITKKRELQIVERHIQDSCLFIHGNKEPKDLKELDIDMIIVGDEHPAISIGNKIRREVYKCFLIGKYRIGLKKKDLLVLPSFNQVTVGVDVVKEQLRSPFLKKNVKNYEVIVVGKELHAFGKVKQIS